MSRPFKRERSALGQTLARLRREYGNVSQAELARRTRGAVSSGHIGQIETGDRGASFDTLLAISDALRLQNPDWEALLESAGFEAKDFRSPEGVAELEALGAKTRPLLDDLDHLEQLRKSAPTEERLAAVEEQMRELSEDVRTLIRQMTSVMERLEREAEQAARRRRRAAGEVPRPRD